MSETWEQAMTELQQGYRRRAADCRALAMDHPVDSAEHKRLWEKASTYGHCAELLFDEIVRLQQTT